MVALIVERAKMRIVKVSRSFFNDCIAHGTDRELLFNERGRPCVLILNLTYRGKRHKFIVPIRSNISGTTPEEQYFPLPTTSNTRPGRKHGIHYIKLFPIKDEYVQKYRVNTVDRYWIATQSIINSHEREIVDACQNILNEYDVGNRHPMTPDIDGILAWLYH